LGLQSITPPVKATFTERGAIQPVYHDPGGTWFDGKLGLWIAEYYYISNDPMAKNLMDKWSTWGRK
jgi:hypothetical protein